MNKRKGMIRWIPVLAALAVLILLLAMCGRSGGEAAEPGAAETVQTEAVTEQTEEPTQPEQETTAPTEETTEPTEETVEETTAPTTSGSTSNSTSDDTDDTDYGEEEAYWEGPDPGTPENPYMEVPGTYPAEVTSVKIPIAKEVSYLVVGSAGSVLTIADPAVSLTLDGAVYTADETTGILTVDLTDLVADPVITLTHSYGTATACLLTLEEGLGGAGNPEMLTNPEELEVKLQAGDANGYHYLWTADVTGQVALTLKEAESPADTAGEETDAGSGDSEAEPAEEPELEVIVTVEDQTLRLSEALDGRLVFDTTEDQQVLIQVIAKPFADGSYPAVEETLLWTRIPEMGTEENPEILTSLEAVSISLAENDRDGYTACWTAAEAGTLVLTVQGEGADFDVTLTDGDGNAQSLSDSADNTLTLELEAGETVTIRAIAIVGEEDTYGEAKVSITGSFAAVPGTSPENPVLIEEGQTEATFALEAMQTVYFSGMVQEMVATVENAAGITIQCGSETAWAAPTGVVEMEFPEGDPAEPMGFCVTAKQNKEVTMTLAYPKGHEKNPDALTLGQTRISLAQEDADGYLLDWIADCDGQLTVAVEGKDGWQYRLDNLTAGTEGETVTGVERTERTAEVKAGDRLRLTLWTLAAENAPRPAGTMTVTASFFDPLLGTEEKPIRLETDGTSTVTIPAGSELWFAAEAEEMELTLRGQNVILTRDGRVYTPENGTLELMCHGTETVFAIGAGPDRDQSCTLTFAYPLGHRENPAELAMGENRGTVADGSLSGYCFEWTAEGNGILTVTMTQDSCWQYVIRNETTDIGDVVHTCGDQPAEPSRTLEVSRGDRVTVTVNTFDREHPLHAPAGEVVFNASFVDPTLGEEENPVWLNLEDTLTIPAGKTMYFAAKADGMILTLLGENVTVRHGDGDYSAENGKVILLCRGTGTFGHPVFAVTNTGEKEGNYSICFVYPEGHYLNPMALTLGEQSLTVGQSSHHYLWTAEADGSFTLTMEDEGGWKYIIANAAAGKAGQPHSAEDEEPMSSETLEVRAGEQLRILIGGTEGDTVNFTADFAPAAEDADIAE